MYNTWKKFDDINDERSNIDDRSSINIKDQGSTISTDCTISCSWRSRWQPRTCLLPKNMILETLQSPTKLAVDHTLPMLCTWTSMRVLTDLISIASRIGRGVLAGWVYGRSRITADSARLGAIRLHARHRTLVGGLKNDWRILHPRGFSRLWSLQLRLHYSNVLAVWKEIK